MNKGKLSWLSLVALSCLLIAGTVSGQETMPEAGAIRTDTADIDQVYVPAGCFLMGTTAEQAQAVLDAGAPSFITMGLMSEQPQHEVCLSSGYWIDTTEVTVAAFAAFVEAGGYTLPEHWSDAGKRWLERQAIEALPIDCEGATAPELARVCVTWYEAEAYAHWRGGALPTDAQWEWAAKGPEGLIYPWGNEWDATHANVVDSQGLVPVGSYPDGVSWVGAHDMAGNAMEWTQTWWTPSYRGAERDDPTGPANGRIKSERGGWWGSNPFVARTTYRHYEDPPSYQDHHIGFRIISPETAASE